MPITEPDGSSLLATNRLINLNKVKIPNSLDIEQQYVIYKDSIWIAGYENETHVTLPYIIEKTSRNGPHWGPKVYVDIIAKIHDSNTDTDYYLKKKNVYIERTD